MRPAEWVSEKLGETLQCVRWKGKNLSCGIAGYLGLERPTSRGMHCNLSSGTDFPKGNPEFCNFHKNTQKTYHKNCVRKDFGLPDSGSRLFSLNSWVQLFKEAPKTCPNISLLAKYNRNSFSFSLLQEFILHHITGTEVLPSCRKLQIYLNILYQYLPT